MPKVDPEEVENYNPPLDCFFIEHKNPLKNRLSLLLSSVMLSLYGREPKALAEIVKETQGIGPVKYDISNGVQLGFLFHIRNVLKIICEKCSHIGECPWGYTLKYLRVKRR